MLPSGDVGDRRMLYELGAQLEFVARLVGHTLALPWVQGRG